ncbi:gliding motility lipoprotein GldH, partial [Porphyromonadaceae bacterium OttesenSCG-928-L07]|nr:gliding motility lipoprotein GldH [Porphyromonadaceae bacterium OttesenSCG-928-L07]
VITLLSCQDKSIYKDFRNIRNEEWCINDTLSFEVHVSESREYNMNLYVRHTTDYEMANLWCFIQVSDSSGTVLKDTVNMKLAEADGRWMGDGNSIKTVKQAINSPHIELNEGLYTIKIEQGMRVKCLKGIKDVGISIETIK